MPSFDIVKNINPEKTFRVSNIVSNFDLDVENINEHFVGNIDIENYDWNVGLIVGGSGTGKSTIAKEVFPEAEWAQYEYGAKSVIDDMPKGKGIKDIELAFTNVGFRKNDHWILKRYGRVKSHYEMFAKYKELQSKHLSNANSYKRITFSFHYKD